MKFSSRDLEGLTCVGDLIETVRRRHVSRADTRIRRRRCAQRRTVLYACTNLAYDQIFTPVATTPGVDFVLFADRRPRFVRGWQWRPLPAEAAGLSPDHGEPLRQVLPARGSSPRPSCSIYVDANTLMLADLTPLIEEFLASGADIGLFPHKRALRHRRGVRVRPAGGQDPALGRREGPGAARAATATTGCRDDHLFTENAIIFRRHGNPALAAAMDLWWEQIATYTQRDQLSLPYVLYKSELKVKLWDWNYKFVNPYFLRYLHRRGIAQRPERASEEQALLRPASTGVTCGAALVRLRTAGRERTALASPPE